MRVIVVDHGQANIFSLINACQSLGVAPETATSPHQLQSADAILLPGVGAFATAMAKLHRSGFVGPLRDRAAAGVPLMGICLGMQMLLDASEEFGESAGLGLVAGRVSRLPDSGAKIPHVGWAALDCDDRDPILRGLSGHQMYFVHSFHAVPKHTETVVATAHHGGRRFAAVVRRGNVYGCQFHPERSAAAGMRLLGNFFDWSRQCTGRQPW